MRSFAAVKKSAGDPCGRPRAGKSPKRHQWRKKRGDFEEVPRLAATTVAGNRLARRWAREPRPYAHHGSILHRADRVVRPYNRFRNISVGRADHSPPLIIHRTPCKNTCHCEAGAKAGRGNLRPSSPSFPFLLFSTKIHSAFPVDKTIQRCYNKLSLPLLHNDVEV